MGVPYHELYDVVGGGLRSTGIDTDRGGLCARIVADSSRDGVASHGLNLFPRLMTMIRAGVVDVQAHPMRVSAYGALERWDGRRGIRALNAHACIAAAIALAPAPGMRAL